MICAFFLLCSCNKQTETVTTEKNTSQEIINPEKTVSQTPSIKLSTGADNLVSYNSFIDFMKPDYTPRSGEEKIKNNKKKNEISASNEKSESVIPGLRNLNEYKTNYTSKRKDTSLNIKSSENSEEIDDPKTQLIISDWGPQGKIVSEAEFPSFYVVFSKPVHALSALETPSEKSDIMTITPPLKGVFRWYGTRHLAFEADEAADPATEYIITINKNTKSIGGTQIKGKTVFTTKAEQVSISRLWGGYMGKGDTAYTNITGALPPYENRFYIKLNYKLTKEKLNELLSVKIGKNNLEYSAEPLYKPELTIYGYPMSEVSCDEEKQKTDSFIVTIQNSVPHNSTITVSVLGGKKDFTYKTLQPFTISNVTEFTDYTEGTKTNPLRISFTQEPDKNTIIDNISFDFDFKLTEDNFEIFGNTLTLFNLPISFNEEHSVTFGNGLKDVYGQSIKINKSSTYPFTVRDAIAYIKFLDYGAKMLEAQFPHKILFEYQNLEKDSYYKIAPTNNPFDLSSEFISYINSNTLPENSSPIVTTKKNTRLFQEVNFDDLLDDGYGFVKFDAYYTKNYFNEWSGEWETDSNTNTMSIQVTDLGVTARIGLNKAVFMIRSLSTGKPVPNAEVSVCLTSDNFNLSADLLASNKSDENGLCIVNFTEEQIKKFENYANKYYQNYMTVFVQNGKDKVLFTPNSHSTWNFNINTDSLSKVRNPIQRTFMFVDRGLYKPGETVTFRGIDRDQMLGSINIHSGSYKISIVEQMWNATPIMPTITGTSSSSGGFYGSVKLPDDIEPGVYFLQFNRTDNGSSSPDTFCSFTVAEFERLKIQASISTPEMTFIGGDKLSAELEASYLAGGVLNGAEYNSSWYKHGYNFTTENLETKDYSFGPYNKYSWRNYYSNESGKLSSSGKAQLACTSEKIKDGLTYNYRVEANVTDVSNQSITTAASIQVHPANVYLGLKKAQNISGFAKKGQELEFPFVLVDTNGQKLTKENLSSEIKNINYVLKHDVWTMVHEQSVNSSVYVRYEKSEVEDETGTIEPTIEGLIKLTPQNAGWHTLEITGKDTNNNDILTSIGFYVTGSGMGWHGSNTSEELTLTPDRNKYNPGDTAQILLESPLQKGDYLITVEREGIFTEEIRHFDEPANVIEIPIANNYLPIVYVAISSYSDRTGKPVHQYGEADLDKPKGYFGICELHIDPSIKSFSVNVESSKQTYLPGEEATLTFTATKGGKPLANAELTVMAVDRGVLDLINYHVPNPIDYFYREYNFPLRVKGGDSRQLLMDPVTYSTKNLLGGDAAEASEEEKDDERKDFRPTALFEPAIITDKNGKATVTFKMPDTLTTYRITAFGVSDDLFALNEAEVKVQNPINIQQVQPRKLRERDTAECGVLITNLDSKGQKVTVSVETRSPIKDTKEDELAGRKTIPGKAFVDGKNEHTVYVASGDSTVVYFDIGAEQAGTVELVYSIKSDILQEKLISPIKIEKTYVYETVTMIGATDDKENAIAKESIIIPGFAKDGRGDLSITLDPTRLGMLGSSVNYLFEYPYYTGLEQQVSRVLPLIIFGDYIDIFGLNSSINNVNQFVLYNTKQWGKSQLKTGGFPYWEGGNNPSFYVSLRVAHICAIAQNLGYTDLGIDLSSLTSYILSSLSDTNIYFDDYTKAYACYVLKLLDNHQADSILNTLYNRLEELTLSTASLVSLAYTVDSGLSSISKSEQINNQIRKYLIPVERSVTVLDTNRENDFWWWYETPEEQMALILQAFVKVNPNDEMVDRLLFTLLQNQSMGHWQNTATTARVLDSISTYIKMRNLDETEFTASASLGDNKLMEQTFSGAAAKPKTLVLPFESEIVSSLEKNKQIPVSFEKTGAGRLYYTMEMKYSLPDEMLKARNEGLGVSFQITDYKTGETINLQNGDDPQLVLESGKLYKASIRIESHRDRTYLALRAPIPSGAEILDSTFVTTGSEGEITSSSSSWGHWISNKTIYDNEIQFFWDNFKTGSATVNFTFRASRRGVYPTPPVQAECLYEPEVFGRSDGYLIEIK